MVAFKVQKRSQMATFTLRSKMRLATSRASSSLKYRKNLSGVSFAKLFLLGRESRFRFASGMAEN
jgi:hypothetical protein